MKFDGHMLISRWIDIYIDGEKIETAYAVDTDTGEVTFPWLPEGHTNPISWLISDRYDLPENAFEHEETVCVREKPENLEVRLTLDEENYVDLLKAKIETA